MTFQKPGVTCAHCYSIHFPCNKINLNSYAKSKPFLRKCFVLSSHMTSKSSHAFQTWQKYITKKAWVSFAPCSVIQVQKHIYIVLWQVRYCASNSPPLPPPQLLLLLLLLLEQRRRQQQQQQQEIQLE